MASTTPSHAWQGFQSGDWQNRIDVRDFIQRNYTPYEGNGDFLAPATEGNLPTVGQRDGRHQSRKPNTRSL